MKIPIWTQVPIFTAVILLLYIGDVDLRDIILRIGSSLTVFFVSILITKYLLFDNKGLSSGKSD